MPKPTPKHALEFPCIGMVNGYVKHICRVGKNAYSFEVWSEVVECVGRDGCRIFENLNSEFRVCKIFALREDVNDEKTLEFLQKNAVVNVVYKRYFVLDTRDIVNIATKIELPDSKYETTVLKCLGTDEDVATIFRFWADKIIKSSCFNVDFF